MQANSKTAALAAVFFLLFAGIIFLVFYEARNLDAFQSEQDMNERAIINLQTDIRTLMAQNKILSEVSGDKIIKSKGVRSSSGLVDFYAEIQKVFSDRDMNIISTRQSGNSISINIHGDYYSLMRALSDLRVMGTVARVKNLNIRRNNIMPSRLVTADITLETLVVE